MRDELERGEARLVPGPLCVELAYLFPQLGFKHPHTVNAVLPSVLACDPLR